MLTTRKILFMLLLQSTLRHSRHVYAFQREYIFLSLRSFRCCFPICKINLLWSRLYFFPVSLWGFSFAPSGHIPRLSKCRLLVSPARIYRQIERSSCLWDAERMSIPCGERKRKEQRLQSKINYENYSSESVFLLRVPSVPFHLLCMPGGGSL